MITSWMVLHHSLIHVVGLGGPLITILILCIVGSNTVGSSFSLLLCHRPHPVVDSSIPNGVNRPPTRRTTTAFLDNGPCYFIDCLSQPSISTSTALLYGNNHEQDIEDDDDDDDDEVDDVDDPVGTTKTTTVSGMLVGKRNS